jgi:nanoRNase/pAp phosphatase (c-di-AMP/oligoRNAs hydrolase)
MPIAGSEVYCKASNKNKDLVSEAEKKIRDEKEKIKKLELEIKQKKRIIKQQERNCDAIISVDTTVPSDIKPFTITGGKKSRKSSKISPHRKNKSRKNIKNKK